ncbi:biliverdin-producing heme oxygenase [Streptomyces sp. NPDC002619]|uniref:biliverdin-producing heme oxygenase n=1 Tax=Streptomyces sp. NPDC002619 TaxID=3364655 RepID=UPI0036CBDFC1
MTPTAVERLRSSTRAWHDTLERTPFATAVVAGALPLDRYVAQLAAYREVLEVLEEELRRATCRPVTSVWSTDLVKLPLVERDLRYFGALEADTGVAAREFAQEIRRTAEAVPEELLGFLYVLEGSTLGAMILRRHVTEAYGLTDPEGVAYYTSGDRTRWTSFTACLNEALTYPDTQTRVLAAAERTYRHVAAVAEELSVGLTRISPPVPTPEQSASAEPRSSPRRSPGSSSRATYGPPGTRS